MILLLVWKRIVQHLHPEANRIFGKYFQMFHVHSSHQHRFTEQAWPDSVTPLPRCENDQWTTRIRFRSIQGELASRWIPEYRPESTWNKRFGNTVRVSYMKMKQLVDQPVSTRVNGIWMPEHNQGVIRQMLIRLMRHSKRNREIQMR